MSVFYKMKCGTEYLNYGRDIVVDYCRKCLKASESVGCLRILDLGAGSGTDLLNCLSMIQKQCSLKVELWALESYAPNVRKLKEHGINVQCFNIENDRFPFENHSIDFIIMNQVLEHTKEIFWIFSEISRILKKGGRCIVGVPNLASLHNRICLMAGKQPTSIRALGPHVRGFTRQDFIDFIETDGYFKVEFFAGSNFYPFPPQISTVLAKRLPNLAVSIFWGIKRTGKKGCFIHVLDNRFYETPYFKGREDGAEI